MKNLFAKLRAESTKRALYRVTLDEITRMPLAMALDLGIYTGDADKIAEYKEVRGCRACVRARCWHWCRSARPPR